jgi:hypothetical protein
VFRGTEFERIKIGKGDAFSKSNKNNGDMNYERIINRMVVGELKFRLKFKLRHLVITQALAFP